VAPVGVPRHDLERLALRKLEKRLADDRPAPLPGRGGAGTLV
jgi:hypothetical protein